MQTTNPEKHKLESSDHHLRRNWLRQIDTNPEIHFGKHRKQLHSSMWAQEAGHGELGKEGLRRIGLIPGTACRLSDCHGEGSGLQNQTHLHDLWDSDSAAALWEVRLHPHHSRRSPREKPGNGFSVCVLKNDSELKEQIGEGHYYERHHWLRQFCQLLRL